MTLKVPYYCSFYKRVRVVSTLKNFIKDSLQPTLLPTSCVPMSPTVMKFSTDLRNVMVCVIFVTHLLTI